jgi:hypothetical protein
VVSYLALLLELYWTQQTILLKICLGLCQRNLILLLGILCGYSHLNAFVYFKGADKRPR